MEHRPGKMASDVRRQPVPVTRPIRALTSWMPTISGYVKMIVHSVWKPNCAPACE